MWRVRSPSPQSPSLCATPSWQRSPRGGTAHLGGPELGDPGVNGVGWGDWDGFGDRTELEGQQPLTGFVRLFPPVPLQWRRRRWLQRTSGVSPGGTSPGHPAAGQGEWWQLGMPGMALSRGLKKQNKSVTFCTLVLVLVVEPLTLHGIAGGDGTCVIWGFINNQQGSSSWKTGFNFLQTSLAGSSGHTDPLPSVYLYFQGPYEQLGLCSKHFLSFAWFPPNKS